MKQLVLLLLSVLVISIWSYPSSKFANKVMKVESRSHHARAENNTFFVILNVLNSFNESISGTFSGNMTWDTPLPNSLSSGISYAAFSLPLHEGSTSFNTKWVTPKGIYEFSYSFEQHVYGFNFHNSGQVFCWSDISTSFQGGSIIGYHFNLGGGSKPFPDNSC